MFGGVLAGVLCFGSLGAQTIGHLVVPVAEVAYSAPVGDLPEAPVPETPATAPEQTTAARPAAPAAAAGSSSSAPAGSEQTTDAATAAKAREQLAEEQLKAQKKQRVLGLLPNFNTSYDAQAVSLTRKQKFQLAWASTTDPMQFGVAAILAGVGQAKDSDYEYGGGIGGYSKRFGANYADTFIGNMIGNAVLPSLLHQDPRYFRLGYGPKTHRILYALATNVICKHDVTGKWEPNYSNVLGNLIGGGISNLYYPADERGVGNTLENALTVTLEGGVGSALQEFWPDISRKLFHKDPTNGLDAKARAADEAKKQAKLNQQ